LEECDVTILVVFVEEVVLDVGMLEDSEVQAE